MPAKQKPQNGFRKKATNMLGEDGTEQFKIKTRVDGALIKEQLLHDPFLHSKTVVGISRWDLLKAVFRKQFSVTVEMSVSGSEGVQRAIMMLDPVLLAKETETMLEDRRISREINGSMGIVGYEGACVETRLRSKETRKG